jgi:predicted nucleic acid-binding protein
VSELPEPNPALTALILSLQLHAGEQAALRLLQRFPSAVLLTDDDAARRAADRLGHEVHGTLGILLRAIRRGLKTQKQVVGLLKAIPKRTTLHVRAGLLDAVIADAQNELM